jgi:hypothetical protein
MDRVSESFPGDSLVSELDDDARSILFFFGLIALSGLIPTRGGVGSAIEDSV